MSLDQISFKPTRIYNLDYESFPGGRRITPENVDNFWNEHKIPDSIQKGRGIYIFGLRLPNSYMPAYVGKTKTTFKTECFTPRNLNIYNGEIIRYEREFKPFLFFLVMAKSKGPVNNKVLLELETYLINLAAEKNPNLANIRGLDKGARFIITDLGGRGFGAPTKNGKAFKQLFNF
ncbi:hypothetical protein CH352_18725 [Leptospira hartskeerlii]|uniref:Uncharacterized protein n=1 Tax=Leptospira hartskeerlii TaxID=2023177 RepID=A0A2M9X894_9LEPT|nr:hypothetical protein [Leptospira hartskeerlii]PJZ23916.1 hypothetical protein CH357_18655 [Leptospira hartskeerlii]PJZ31942.1 hypothetical protein CH352_18725 [Leptospira hartskeerlii]